jgi:hypothetical protein
MSDFLFENVLLVAPRMRFMPISSYLNLIVGWKLLKELRKHNKMSLLKPENPPLFLALKRSLPLLLPLH